VHLTQLPYREDNRIVNFANRKSPWQFKDFMGTCLCHGMRDAFQQHNADADADADQDKI
jgi:hypothetical protein